ncbi:hypothetical protein Fcan01_19875 [Folsomia candida]|uniref:Uncharacterized protein n=1 Tax=Folsomia candida TaxID=158441 RepID=A0A226DJH0_FOLCA|nr:hypothetical protein Fcan01_19875 [Folsomia candida]
MLIKSANSSDFSEAAPKCHVGYEERHSPKIFDKGRDLKKIEITTKPIEIDTTQSEIVIKMHLEFSTIQREVAAKFALRIRCSFAQIRRSFSSVFDVDSIEILCDSMLVHRYDIAEIRCLFAYWGRTLQNVCNLVFSLFTKL